MIKDTYLTFVNSARGLGDYQKLSKNELAEGYIQARNNNDEAKTEQYYSALILRYWYKIYEWNRTSKSCRLELDDFVSWMVLAFQHAFEDSAGHGKGAAWKDPNNKLYGDPNGFDKVINRCLFSVRNYYYQEFNRDKRKVNYLVESLDSYEDNNQDSSNTNLENILFKNSSDYYKSTEDEDSSSFACELIQNLLNRGKIKEAIIVDNIAYQDSFLCVKNVKEEEDEESGQKEKYTTYSDEFNKRKLIKSLSNINEKYINYFLNRFHTNVDAFKETITKLQKTSNNSLYRYVNGTLEFLKEDSIVKELLC